MGAGLESQPGLGLFQPGRCRSADRSRFHDVFGNVWQWLEDHFNPLPGARVHPYYDDFSTPCYDGQHQMMLGGSWISTGDEASIWRAFISSAFYQHAGFRLVKSDSDGGSGTTGSGQVRPVRSMKTHRF